MVARGRGAGEGRQSSYITSSVPLCRQCVMRSDLACRISLLLVFSVPVYFFFVYLFIFSFLFFACYVCFVKYTQMVHTSIYLYHFICLSISLSLYE